MSPLVILALFWDRLGARRRESLGGRKRHLHIAGRDFTITTLDLVAAVGYTVMGLALVIIGVTGTTLAPTSQAAVGTWIEDLLTPLVRWLEPVPDLIVSLALVAMAAAAIAISGRRRSLLPEDPDLSSEGAVMTQRTKNQRSNRPRAATASTKHGVPWWSRLAVLAPVAALSAVVLAEIEDPTTVLWGLLRQSSICLRLMGLATTSTVFSKMATPCCTSRWAPGVTAAPCISGGGGGPGE